MEQMQEKRETSNIAKRLYMTDYTVNGLISTQRLFARLQSKSSATVGRWYMAVDADKGRNSPHIILWLITAISMLIPRSV